MDFESRKKQVLASLVSEEPDKSRKGCVDAPIFDLIDAINKIPSYYTTSSCSGRISILQELSSAEKGQEKLEKKKKKKKAGEWIFMSHGPADPDHVVNLLFSRNLNSQDEDEDGGLMVFRFEPFILALDCSDISAAQSLVSSAISCGFRESGITSIGKRIMVALRCSIRMEVPIADKGHMLVSGDYIRFLVNLANSKMEANKKRIDRFFKVIQEQVGNYPSIDNHPCQLQGSTKHVKGKQRTTGKKSSDKRSSRESFRVHNSVVELECRQLNILSLITELEEIVTGYNSHYFGIPVNNCYSDCHDENDSPCKEFSVKYGGHDDTCNSSSFSYPQHYISGQTSISRYQTSGLDKFSGCRLMIIKMKIDGEPVEKLFRWGHSTCVSHFTSSKSLLIFGGYGGRGRHSRQNDTLVLDIESGDLKTLNVRDPPTPRMGHTASLVGQYMFIIGGREDPTRILSDVWLLDMSELKWHKLEFSGEVLSARHRHAAAVVGSCIYVFGGIHDTTIYGDMYVLDTNILNWKQVEAKGELPSARHSHSLAVRGSKIYLYGGYDGNKILGDTYTYDVEAGHWNKVEAIGITPAPKFSHSMVVFNKYLVIIGGCPLTKQFQEFALLDLELLVWRHVSVSSMGDSLLVRSTANVVGDELVIIGGGCSCYAFGAKFNEPLKLSLHSMIFSKQDHQSDRNGETMQHVTIHQTNATNVKYSANYIEIENRLISQIDKPFLVSKTGNEFGQSDRKQGESEPCETMISQGNGLCPSSKSSSTIGKSDKKQNEGETMHRNSIWILQVDKFSAKLTKDALKKLGWLDMSRKARVIGQGSCICFPIIEEAAFFFHRKYFGFIDKTEDQSFMHAGESSVAKLQKGVSKNDVSVSSLLNILISCHGIVTRGDICSRSKEIRTPQELLQEAVSLLIKQKGLSPSMLEELPSRWERLGDMAVLPMTSFTDETWHSVGKELWVTVARALGVQRIARQGRIAATGTRDSTLELLLGDNGWVEHRENGILYCFDARKCMFSSGNISEKLRMAKLDCRNEIVVDLFAGIGYFVLPFLLKAGAKLVYACEWNSSAVAALRHNVAVNGVEDRCIILEGDNTITAPRGVAHRVCLGLLPSSELSWCTAVRALRPGGGILHVHGNVKDSEENSWLENLALSIQDFALAEGYIWKVSIEHVERVKWYAPHIRHLVADVRCQSL